MKFNLNIIFKTVIILLIGASLFFTIQVITFKKGLNIDSTTLTIRSGEEATVNRIIDGDEVAVSRGEERFVIRILGIRSYDPTINDLQLQNAGQLAYTFLKEYTLNKTVVIRFERMKLDTKKRLLAYIHTDNMDIGAAMISRGITLTYRRYPFSRMEEYLELEKISRKNRKGFWSRPAIIKTSDRLIQLWEKQRREAKK